MGTASSASADVELTAAESFDALHSAFAAMTGSPRAALALKDFDVKKAGRWVIVTLQFHGQESNEITLRIRKQYAQTLRLKLNRILG